MTDVEIGDWLITKEKTTFSCEFFVYRVSKLNRCRRIGVIRNDGSVVSYPDADCPLACDSYGQWYVYHDVRKMTDEEVFEFHLKLVCATPTDC